MPASIMFDHNLIDFATGEVLIEHSVAITPTPELMERVSRLNCAISDRATLEHNTAITYAKMGFYGSMSHHMRNVETCKNVLHDVRHFQARLWAATSYTYVDLIDGSWQQDVDHMAELKRAWVPSP